MNMLISYVFAESSAQKYNVADKQKLQSLALVSGMVSPNPIFNYLIVENEAKKLEVINTEGDTVVTIASNSDGTTSSSTPKEGTTTAQQTITEEKLYRLIKNATQEVIKDTFSPNVLKSKNIDEVQLEREILDYTINDQKKSIENLESDYKFIVSHKYFNDLSDYEKNTIAEFKKAIVDKGILERFKKVLKSKNFNGNVILLLFNISSMYSSKIFSIKYSLEKIELEKKEFDSKLESEENKDSSTKKTATKK